MRRLALILVAIVSVTVLAVAGIGASEDDSGTYEVRAIFDSAFSVIPGEDVRVAGVTVGAITDLEVTEDNKAAVVLRIDKDGFKGFRRDATCEIRPQSLIGERFVECTPTQPRAEGAPAPPELDVVPDGEDGAGQRLLPVSQTGQQVDLDLINNIMRLPFRQRFSILLNEFGTALAGRGAELNSAIRRAVPALRETRRVLNILGQQNRVLADLARDGDAVLQPLAERRRDVADFVVKANDVARATAERRDELQAGFQRLPRFLEELQPTMVRLGAFADEATPVFEDLRVAAPSLSRFMERLGPFSQASIPAIESLGEAAEVGREAIPETKEITEEVGILAQEARPLSTNLRSLLENFRDSGGIERLMDYVFFQVAAINGYDTVGHYLRAALIVNTCSTYSTTPLPGCRARIGQSAEARAASVGPPPKSGDEHLDRSREILWRIAQGEDPEAAGRAVLGDDYVTPEEFRNGKPAATTSQAADADADGGAEPALAIPTAMLPGDEAPPAPARRQGEKKATRQDRTGAMLDYLLADGGA
jgi:ABC-type transporter Mla subunit MlaD